MVKIVLKHERKRIPDSRREFDGFAYELGDTDAGYTLKTDSGTLHAADCTHEPTNYLEPWESDRVLAAWHSATDAPMTEVTNPRWCRTCLALAVDPTAHAYSSRERIEAVGRAAAVVLSHLFGDRASVVDPSCEIWTAENTEYLRAAIEDMDAGPGTFFEKLQTQLSSAPREVILLAAEILYLRGVPLTNIRTQTKREHVQTVLSWLPDEPAIPGQFVAGTNTGGCFNGGQGFNQQLWLQVLWLARFIIRWSELSNGQRDEALADPWVFRSHTAALTGDVPSMRNAFLFLALPEVFDNVISDSHKTSIRDAFTHVINGATGTTGEAVDRDLLAIRAHLEGTSAERVNWYGEPWQSQWRPGKQTDGSGNPAADFYGAPRNADSPTLERITSEVAADLHLEVDWLNEFIALLESRRQVIVHGPPGTGKTYLARQLAQYLAGDEAVYTVQFHPSYSYEDFFEGYRPTTATDGSVGFKLRKGPLKRVAARAQRNPDTPHVLIIDEINRGNIAKVFGELYFLLEYRDEQISLQYSPKKKFSLPKNLFIIGTMNTADRSIALIDTAIRRRFSFIEMHPDSEPVAGLLGRWLETNGLPPSRAHLLAALNRELGEANRDFQIGPSYLMRAEADTPEGIGRIWRHDILPLLEEQFYGQYTPRQVAELYGLGALETAIELHSADAVIE